MKLPQMSDRGMMRPVVQTQFGGLNNNLSAVDGEIVWMDNMSSREYPLLTPRMPRALIQTLTAPCALGAHEELFWVDGTGFYYEGVYRGEVIASERKQFAVMGSMILIFPDKKYYNFKDGTFGNLEQNVSETGVSFQDGVFAEVPATANTIYKEGAAWDIRAGDAVTISGCVVHPENNKTPVVREVDGDYLRFDENTFYLGEPAWRYTVEDDLYPAKYGIRMGDEERVIQFESGTIPAGAELVADETGVQYEHDGIVTAYLYVVGVAPDRVLDFTYRPEHSYTEPGSITISRQVPDLDFICVNENRLWGCKGDTIYASALGDPYNFNVFDGLSTDSWASDTTDAGDFTGCVSYQGYPIFFKEDSIFKIQGDGATNFAWTRTSRFGVKEGCEGSLAIAGETLFYLGRVGVCAYQGGMPQVISEPLGKNRKWYDAVAGSDGIRYYISMEDEDEERSLFCFDTRYGEWFREDGSRAVGFAFLRDQLFMLSGDGGLYIFGAIEGDTDAPVTWQVKFADSYRFYETTDSGSQNKKGPLRILIRAALAEGTTIEVKIKYDDGSAHPVGTLTGSAGEKKKTYIIPLILRRCDHYRLSLDGVGDAVIYSIAIEKYSGAQFQGSSVTLPNADGM